MFKTTHPIRLTLATLLSPFIGVTLSMFCFLLLYQGVGIFFLWQSTTLEDTLIILTSFFSFVGTYSAAIGLPVTIVFGLPAHIFLQYKKYSKLIFYLISGALIPALILPVIFFGWTNRWDREVLYLTLLFSGIGACCAGCFWFIRRPDKYQNLKIGAVNQAESTK